MKRSRLERNRPMRRMRAPEVDATFQLARIFGESVRAQAISLKNKAKYECERCREIVRWPDAHHLCSRARGVGHPNLHDPDKNGAALCRECHTLVTDHVCEDWGDWIKTRRWLDLGGRSADQSSSSS